MPEKKLPPKTRKVEKIEKKEKINIKSSPFTIFTLIKCLFR